MKEEKFVCRKCSKIIGGHNQYCHDGMCDDCFFEEYFPEEAQVFETNLEKIKKECKFNEKENLRFREFIKFGDFNQAEFNKIVKEIENKIDCTKCGNCCKVMDVALNEKDIKRISSHLKISRQGFVQLHLIKNFENDFELKNKPCVFFEKNKCKIYAVRPESCKQFPFLHKNLIERTLQFLQNAEICPIAFNALENAKTEYSEKQFEFENLESQDFIIN